VHRYTTIDSVQNQYTLQNPGHDTSYEFCVEYESSCGDDDARSECLSVGTCAKPKAPTEVTLEENAEGCESKFRVKWTVGDSVDEADGVQINGHKIMIATRDLKDTHQLCDEDSDCSTLSGDSACDSETRTCHETNYVEYDYCYLDEMEDQDCVVYMEILAVSPWNLKAEQDVDIHVVTDGNCEFSNPTRAQGTTIKMYDAW
jgi:hypothetical protein